MREERLDKVKAWVLADMGDAFDPLWRDAIRCLDRVTVRAEFTHGDSMLLGDVELPLVCIGDSQRNCGLGGGGILAMQDAIELSKLLEADGAFDGAGRPNLTALRAAEETLPILRLGDAEDPLPSLLPFANHDVPWDEINSGGRGGSTVAASLYLAACAFPVACLWFLGRPRRKSLKPASGRNH